MISLASFFPIDNLVDEVVAMLDDARHRGGEKRKIGEAAEHDYEEGKLAVSCPCNCSRTCELRSGQAGRRTLTRLRRSDLLIGTAALLPVAVKIGRDVRKMLTSSDRAA